MAGGKIKGLYTDDKDSWEDEDVSRKHKKLFKQMAVGRVCKYTIAQVMIEGVNYVNVEHCVLKEFFVPYKSLTKKEKKVMDFVFSVAEAGYWQKAKGLLLIDPKFGNNIKVATEMAGGSSSKSADNERILNISIRSKDGVAPSK